MLSSIKLRLVVWFMSTFSVALTGLGLFLYFELHTIVIDSIDEHLHSEIQLLATLVSVEEEEGHLETELVELEEAKTGDYAVPLSGHYYQLLDGEGDIIARSPSLTIPGKKLPILTDVYEAVSESIIGPGGREVRFQSQTFNYHDIIVTIQAAESIEEALHVISSFKRILLILLPALFLLSIFGIYVTVGLALRRLDEFSWKVGHITETSLNERLELEGTDEELKPLASNFNTMLGHLEESFEKQRQFMSDASHELRTPTSVIKSTCDVILTKERDTDEYKEGLRSIGDSANKMAEIINSILDLGRFDSKAYRIELGTINVKEMIDNLLITLKPSAEAKGVTLSASGPETVVYGDEEALKTVFSNLIENGIKYNKSGGSVDVKVRESARELTIDILDTGIGIAGEDIERVFDRFYRVDKSRSLVPGSGLGLPIVRSMIDAHGGTLTVSSKLGVGTTFTVTLPLKPSST